MLNLIRRNHLKGKKRSVRIKKMPESYTSKHGKAYAISYGCGIESNLGPIYVDGRQFAGNIQTFAMSSLPA